MKSSTAVALRVSTLLVKSGMTRYAFCRKIAMPENTLKHILDGDYKSVRLDTVILLAEGFDMSLQEFLNDELFKRSSIEAD